MPESSQNAEPKTVLITGASAGIGKATALHLAEAGYRVFGTSRQSSTNLTGIEMLELEVTDDASVAACKARIDESTGGQLDVLINNVGTGILGAAEESSIAQVQRLFDINFFGAVRMTLAFLPGMRARGRGRILFLSSAGGIVSTPYASYYCATKHALEAFVESLRLEVEDFGVQAALIAPGTVSTSAGDKAMNPDRPVKAYAPQRQNSVEKFVEAIRAGMPPDDVAHAILNALRDDHMQPRYTVGTQSWGVSLMKSLLPQQLLEAGIRRTTITP